MTQTGLNRNSSQLVFCTSGCFLFFHEGHKELLGYLVSAAKDYPIFIGVNSDQYIYKKHEKIISEIAEDSSISLTDKIKLQNDLDQTYRANTVKNFVGDRAEVIITDDLYSLLQEDNNFKITWVLGCDYVNKDFKEKSKVFSVYFTPRTQGKSSSKKLKQLKGE